MKIVIWSLWAINWIDYTLDLCTEWEIVKKVLRVFFSFTVISHTELQIFGGRKIFLFCCFASSWLFALMLMYFLEVCLVSVLKFRVLSLPNINYAKNLWLSCERFPDISFQFSFTSYYYILARYITYKKNLLQKVIQKEHSKLQYSDGIWTQSNTFHDSATMALLIYQLYEEKHFWHIQIHFIPGEMFFYSNCNSGMRKAVHF